MKEKAKSAGGAPLAALTAELDACRKAVDFCFDLALTPEQLPAGERPRVPWNKMSDLSDRFHVMRMAIDLMEASGALAEAIARLKGELRQNITVDKYNHGPAGGARPQTLSTQRLQERRENARAIQHQGEGGAPETEKRMGE